MSARVLITGGAGFVGTNVAHRLLTMGVPVTVFDNLSRPGVERNLRWLLDTHGSALRIELGDVRDAMAVRRAARDVERAIHLAAQVAVTTSVVDPVHDFDINARGTLNVLTALAAMPAPPQLLFTSTNKVYGTLPDVEVRGDGRRYRPVDARHRHGIGEDRPLDFHSPYGCSKGAADQYVLDYARTYGLRSTVFRMSCIYGPHQFGTEDQGWVAHFLIRALRGERITLFGNGQQVRDILFVDDLVDAMLLAFDHPESCAGRAFNMGGGPANAVSLLELIDMVGDLCDRAPRVEFDRWRPADQRYYVSDTSRFRTATGWRARVPATDGVRRLHQWLVDSGMMLPVAAAQRSTPAPPARRRRPAALARAASMAVES
jgi:CDP-paratose 2-epimerase